MEGYLLDKGSVIVSLCKSDGEGQFVIDDIERYGLPLEERWKDILRRN